LTHQVLQILCKEEESAAMWLQEEEYSEFVMGLHWVSLRGNGFCKFKVSAKVSTKGVCNEILL
jgi:hypothetical protein